MTRALASRFRVIALGVMSAVAGTAFAQFRQDPIYDQREVTAPPTVKNLLVTQRMTISSRGLHFVVGFTHALEIGVSKITGGHLISDPTVVPRQNEIARKISALDAKALSNALLANPSLKSKIPILNVSPQPTWGSLDWRQFGMVSPIKDQRAGTCWCYASIAALESSSRLLNNQPIDASEQYLDTNDTAGYYVPGNWNGGGYAYLAITYLVSNGTVTEASDADSDSAGTPNPNEFKPYGGTYWGFCHGAHGQATVGEIKTALCAHGPVATWIDAGGTFGTYTGGVYDDTSTDSVEGHFVAIIGWDDSKQAWLIKNSWGTTWGDTCGYGSEKGYAWVHYGVHGIGSDSCWVHDHTTYWQLDLPIIEKLLGTKILHAIK